MGGMAIGIGGEEIPPRERFCRLIKAVKKADRFYVPMDCGLCLSTFPIYMPPNNHQQSAERNACRHYLLIRKRTIIFLVLSL